LFGVSTIVIFFVGLVAVLHVQQPDLIASVKKIKNTAARSAPQDGDRLGSSVPSGQPRASERCPRSQAGPLQLAQFDSVKKKGVKKNKKQKKTGSLRCAAPQTTSVL
jgi:hypothetical protein